MKPGTMYRAHRIAEGRLEAAALLLPTRRPSVASWSSVVVWSIGGVVVYDGPCALDSHVVALEALRGTGYGVATVHVRRDGERWATAGDVLAIRTRSAVVHGVTRWTLTVRPVQLELEHQAHAEELLEELEVRHLEELHLKAHAMARRHAMLGLPGLPT